MKWQVYPWSGAQALNDEDYGSGRRFDSLYCLLMAGVLQIHSTNLFITQDDGRTKDRGRRKRDKRGFKGDMHLKTGLFSKKQVAMSEPCAH